MATAMTLGKEASEAANDEARAPGTPIRSLHMMSFRCFDAEETRRFYEDFLGLEFCAAIPTTAEVGGKQVEAMRLLFRMANGDFFSFYDVPDDARPDMYERVGPFDSHFAMKVPSEADWHVSRRRLEEANIQYLGPLDHGSIISVYFQDPNGIWLEYAYEVAQHEEIVARETAEAPEAMRGWIASTSEQKMNFKKAMAAK